MARDYDASCELCAHAIREGWFGLNKETHCPRRKKDGTFCHATWGGTRTIHCVQCHLTFSSPSALDLHQPRNGICIDPRVAKTAAGFSLFGEPRVNERGTEIWSGATRTDRWYEMLRLDTKIVQAA